MSEDSRMEQARAEREARDAVPHRGAGGTRRDAVQAGMATYLASEQYHSQDRRPPSDEATPSGRTEEPPPDS